MLLGYIGVSLRGEWWMAMSPNSDTVLPRQSSRESCIAAAVAAAGESIA